MGLADSRNQQLRVYPLIPDPSLLGEKGDLVLSRGANISRHEHVKPKDFSVLEGQNDHANHRPEGLNPAP